MYIYIFFYLQFISFFQGSYNSNINSIYDNVKAYINIDKYVYIVYV